METQNLPAKHDIAVSLADANRRYKRAVESVLEAYETQPTEAPEVTPGQLHAAIEQFLATSLQLEHMSGPSGPIAQKDVSELGDYGITLLMDLGAWARQLGLDSADAEFDQIALAFADWVMRHDGEIRTLEPLVDALARLANRAREPEKLEDLAHLMTRVIHSTAARARQDHAKTRPSEPWRLLHLNRGIVATRTHNTTLMEQVFDELVCDLPTDARQFFADGMQQMDRFGYPVTVRTVMARYFDRWTRTRMH